MVKGTLAYTRPRLRRLGQEPAVGACGTGSAATGALKYTRDTCTNGAAVGGVLTACGTGTGAQWGSQCWHGPLPITTCEAGGVATAPTGCSGTGSSDGATGGTSGSCNDGAGFGTACGTGTGPS
jgi:hypothetical protein